MTATTALTAQNTLGVVDIHYTPPPFIRKLIDAVRLILGINCYFPSRAEILSGGSNSSVVLVFWTGFQHSDPAGHFRFVELIRRAVH
jgi:hypothetical protein